MTVSCSSKPRGVSVRRSVFGYFALTFLLFCALPLFSLAVTPAWARDRLFDVLFSAQRSLSQGEARELVISNLTAAVSAEPNSTLVPFTQNLIAELKRTAEKAKRLSFSKAEIREHPERYLMETRVESYLVAKESYFLVNRQNRLIDQLAKKHPEDPASMLFAAGRPAIERLIDLLDDTSIARTVTGGGVNYSLPNFMRAGEVAMCLIEQLSGCDFLLEKRTLADQGRIIPHVRKWWIRNGGRTREEGIRDELESAYSQTADFNRRQYGMIWMALNLAESGQTKHADYAEQVLEDMVRSHGSMQAAEGLVRLGSRRGLEVLRERFETSKAHPSRVFSRSEISFLIEYGGLAEWRILHALVESEINTYGQLPELTEGPNRIGVLPVLVEDANSRPLWIVPCLALALKQTRLHGEDEFYAADAVELLDKLTGENFGFSSTGSVRSRRDAAERALEWWNTKGGTAYSFDRIAALWQKMIPPEPPNSTIPKRRRPLIDQNVPDGLYEFSWRLKRQATAPGERPPESEATRLVVRVANNEVTCVKSSNSAVVGSKGLIRSEGQGRFGFHLPIEGYEGLSHQWLANIDGSFAVKDRDGGTLVRPITADR